MDDLSRELYARACQLMPGGVNSPVRACRNVDCDPVFIEKASGSHLTDVDGKTYIDYVLSWGPMLLGHADPDVVKELVSAARNGSSFGAPCPGEVWLAEEITAAIPAMEMLRMVNSGTEATMSAARVARAATGRDKIIKFIGCYHGHADTFLAAAGSGVATFAIPGTPGVTSGAANDTLLVPYNDLNAATMCFARYGSQIAAVIVEPVAANMGLVLPLPGFLQGLRQLCDEYRSLLIFDEVITGFRIDYGGATKRFEIGPDLITLGKIIGGGLPVGCFGGKKKLMAMVSPDGPVYQAGTLSGNPLAMAAGLATLRKLKKMDYRGLEQRTGHFASELREIFSRKGIAAQVPTIASMFAVFFSETPVANFEQAKSSDQKLYASFYRQMRKKGIYLAPSPFETGMLSFAHSEEDLSRTLEAADTVEF